MRILQYLLTGVRFPSLELTVTVPSESLVPSNNSEPRSDDPDGSLFAFCLRESREVCRSFGLLFMGCLSLLRRGLFISTAICLLISPVSTTATQYQSSIPLFTEDADLPSAVPAPSNSAPFQALMSPALRSFSVFF